MMCSKMSRRSALSGSNQTRERPNQGEMNMNIGKVHFDTPRTVLEWFEGLWHKHVKSGCRITCVSCHLHSGSERLLEEWMTDNRMKKLCLIIEHSPYRMIGYLWRGGSIEFYELTTIVYWLSKCAQMYDRILGPYQIGETYFK